ncbi:MAG: hypothetical protein IKS07_07630 [Lachnospiraceae bacterium]|nr:hypothetical protein [Lachnospiraceae bacterium]
MQEPREARTYENYIRDHAGDYEGEEKDVLVVQLARGITAFELLRAQAGAGGSGGRAPDFDRRLIHSQAEVMREVYALDDLSEGQLHSLLKTPEALSRARQFAYENAFALSDREFAALAGELQELQKSLASARGETGKYRELVDRIDDLVQLWKQPDTEKEERTRSLFYLVAAIDALMKGNRGLQEDQVQRVRFDHALDTLAVISRHAPHLKEKVKRSVRKINFVRKAGIGNPEYIAPDLEAYGPVRAARQQTQG